MLLNRLIKFFCSLRLTVACLCLGLVLVFVGTLAQVDLGLYKAQNEFFRSFLIYWGPKGAGWKIPVFPGGYLVGGLLLANLVAAHIQRFKFEGKKIGLWMIHFGLIMMLLGQLLTDLLAVESGMRLRIGETKNYSESDRVYELAVVDTSGKDQDQVVSIPESMVARGGEIRSAALPFALKVTKYFPNASLRGQKTDGFVQPDATQGAGKELWLKEMPKVTVMEERDLPSAVIELSSPKGSLGRWLVSPALEPQVVTIDQRVFEIGLRGRRYYKPFSVHLDNFNHGTYKGTEIAMDYSSMVHLHRPDTGEDRSVRIYMNNPLRYDGETFYQASFDRDDKGTTLQVVHNPSWLTPYFACGLVGVGMLVQFGMHLIGFIKKRTVGSTTAIAVAAKAAATGKLARKAS